MLFNEWNLDQLSIFAELDDLNPNTLIGEIGVSFLTAYYKMNYGEKIVPKSIVKMSNAEVAQIINGRFYSQWERIHELYSEKLPVGFESETTVDETFIDSGSKEVSNNSTNKVTAYNDDSFSDDNSNDTMISESDNRDRNKQYSQKKTSLDSLAKQKNIAYNENMTNVICSDISKVVSLSIY